MKYFLALLLLLPSVVHAQVVCTFHNLWTNGVFVSYLDSDLGASHSFVPCGGGTTMNVNTGQLVQVADVDASLSNVVTFSLSGYTNVECRAFGSSVGALSVGVVPLFDWQGQGTAAFWNGSWYGCTLAATMLAFYVYRTVWNEMVGGDSWD